MRDVPFTVWTASRRDFDQILGSLSAFRGQRDVAHLHHPMAIEEFGDSALVILDPQETVAAYLFGMIVSAKHRGYVHVVAVREDQRGRGHARRLYARFAELATTRGCQEIKAITSPENAGSIAFHESIGMHGREIPDYSGPGRTRIVFSRDLTPAPTAHPPPIERLILRPAAAEDVADILSFWNVAAEDTRSSPRPPRRLGLR